MWYSERDVERAAWRVYGGPLGFEKYLREAHEVYQAKDAPYKAKVTFSYPDAYVYVVSPEHAFANEMAIEEAQRAAEAAEAKKRADALNESKWRKSTLTARKKIMKTDALKKYHLQDYDLVGLDVEYKKFNIPGRRTQGTKHMYKEKEVELVAWRKHGGPDGFAAQ
ncbi:hypothetical protein BKA70DRAFT_730013 [Coprinopsis sp. MPI-PUGE-AT-0042]|nr:hypothetical protein BKA70DRAFT_730013 [Coprinopsis sp. MPI-PUGE-AT-0042]